jgi:DeoR/GlpR family transcriptional regulator of sugar metabolism
MSTNAAAKSRIARACVAMISNGDAVFLDAGSTVLGIAELLAHSGGHEPRPKNVNVLTNALPVAQTIAGEADVRHTVLGGTLRPAGECFVGLTDQGFTVADLAEAQVKRAVIERARRAIVAMDHSKLGASDFAKVRDLGDVTAITTDYLDELCQHAGVEIIVAD